MFRARRLHGIPVLSPGKHRSPRAGACFMEYASFLAGESWSDRPACTHPLVACVARGVNDSVSDDARSGLVELVPSVIGVVGDDDGGAALDLVVSVRSAATALPHVAEHRQRALAVGLLAAERVAADDRLPSPTHAVFEHGRQALAAVPDARAKARQLMSGHTVDLRPYRRRSAPTMVRVAVEGLADAAGADVDRELTGLLAAVIADSRAVLGLGDSPRVSEPAAAG